MLELDGLLGATLQQGHKRPPMVGLAERLSTELRFKHHKVVGDSDL